VTRTGLTPETLGPGFWSLNPRCGYGTRIRHALEIGSYEGAVPHIGEAVFHTESRMTFESHVLAIITAVEIAGQAFVVALAEISSHVDEED